ncbi:MAG: acetate--CoA ligase family protein [Desulfococcaceae bacterium]
MLESEPMNMGATLNEAEAKALLAGYGVPTVVERQATTVAEAVSAAEEIGYPAVLKGLGSRLTHKTELGLVRVGLTDAPAVERAAREVTASTGSDLEGFLVQPLISGTREFVAGLFRDPRFGPVVMFGLGGVLTEALGDVAFRVAPLERSDAEDMLEGLGAAALLGPFRGEAAVDRETLIHTLTGLSRLAMERPDVAEVDLNPLIAGSDGAVTSVDALVALRPPVSPPYAPPPVDPVRLGQLFHPRSAAFVGASARLGKWGQILFSLTVARGFEGKVFLVNPKGGKIAGRPVYPTVADIPEPVDLAVVTVPAGAVPDLIPQFQEKGIRHMVLISSGFAEVGDEGRAAERALMDQARKAGILLVGPNTMGICNPHKKFYCTGSHVWPAPGDTAVVSQSGNMGAQLLAFAEQQGIGVRAFAGSGNEGMATVEDYLEAFEMDEATRNVILYLESVKDGRRFFEVARRLARKKPVMLLKGGRTGAGQRAAASHTGALAGDRRVFDAVCAQAGIVQAYFPMDLLDLSAAFSSLPIPAGPRTAIMTLGGGWGVVTADLCAEHGLEVPPLSPAVTAAIDEFLPPYWSRSNPVDIVGEHEDRVAIGVLKTLMAWDGCDAIINLGIMGRRTLLGRVLDSSAKADPAMRPEDLEALKARLVEFEENYVRLIAELMAKHEKPVYGVSISFDQVEKTVLPVEDSPYNGVFYPTPERAVKALAAMNGYRRFRNRTA